MKFSFFIKNADAEELAKEHVQQDACQARLSRKYRAYYQLRPLVPLAARRWMQKYWQPDVKKDWYIDDSFMRKMIDCVQRDNKITIIHPWPNGAQFAFVLTHDVETSEGLQNIEKIAKLEEDLGFRSSWNIVPHKYKIDVGLIADLKSRGFEIGIHGYNHDGKLFLSKNTFHQRAGAINAAVREYQAVGFRAPMVHRSLEWLQQLDIQYDASCFDIDPFQPMPGGVGSIWPFVCGKLVELPYTLPQDHTLFIALGERDCRIWKDKLDYIASNSGMALMLTHPDYLNTDRYLDLYRQFLLEVHQMGGYWHALPSEVAQWWRRREESHLIADAAGDHSIQGPAQKDGVTCNLELSDSGFHFRPQPKMLIEESP